MTPWATVATSHERLDCLTLRVVCTFVVEADRSTAAFVDRPRPVGRDCPTDAVEPYFAEASFLDVP